MSNQQFLHQTVTFVCPNLYCVWSTSMEPRSFSEAFLLSMNCPSGITLAFNTLYLKDKFGAVYACLLFISLVSYKIVLYRKYTNLCLKSPYSILLGKPFLQILIPSSTPLQRSWWMTNAFSIRPKFTKNRFIKLT